MPRKQIKGSHQRAAGGGKLATPLKMPPRSQAQKVQSSRDLWIQGREIGHPNMPRKQIKGSHQRAAGGGSVRRR